MNASQIEKNVTALVENYNKEEFVFDLLKAYGISKTSITRLKKGDFNLSKVAGEVLYKSKLLFKEVASGDLLNTIDKLTKEPDTLKHNPRFVIVTDYKTLLAKDIRTGLALDIPILEIHKHFGFFLPWAGQEKYAQTNENYADRKASYKMAKLYDILVTENPNIYDDGGHNLNIFLSRLLFCFFAEDTDIFPIEGLFTDTLEQHTQKDGSDTHSFLDRLFKVLNTKDNSQEATSFKAFPYVNGGLFRDPIVSPKFTKEARKIIIECGDLDWSEINPDIFGSMIQAVVNPAYRSGLGMHYTSVPNIMKVIEPLFLNELYEEFEKQKGNAKKLRQLIFRLSKLKIFDPACGSGNFLIIAYKELRKLEILILQELHPLETQHSIVFTELKLSQFYGIELDDFAHEMAILSLWLAEHQMNKFFVDELHGFGKAKPILPLKEAGNITQGNATRLSWADTCPKNENDEIYILGNPPYLGSFLQSKEQKSDLALVCNGFKSYKDLDYIACWFIKSALFVQKDNVKYAYVTTNSICQGEQVSLLWPFILSQGLEIFFAYNSFKWTNNAKGNAGVYCTIIGIQNKTTLKKKIFNQTSFEVVDNINAYLTSGSSVVLKKRTKPLSKIPPMNYGSKIVDSGNLIFSTEEKNELIEIYPEAEVLIKRLLGSAEFIRGKQRWCLYVSDDQLQFAESIPQIAERFEKVKAFREKSTEKSTREMSKQPHKFYYSVHNNSDSIIIPRTSSQRRDYIPMGFLDGDTIVSDAASVIFNATIWNFGIITSRIHMDWVKAVGGRLKEDYRYSSQLCYNTFPFPEINQKQKEQINLHVFELLEEREKHSGKTLAQLYDPNKMPKGLKEAHHQLDLAIERCYRLKPFTSDTERLEYLFKEYEKMIKRNTLLEKGKKTRKTKKA
ncbi:class I SAM-dependent DNA methyltransferase [Bizionia gelidisalsuginis]|uniref:site-specific DNA-methyltransferase (adenine-specific) n=1 Tax=Bizionia gelidisalsuginis TaxID=291188 RepID=A0ABY3M706_9FLAO|nr:DNA methyltransferase [Bizionia gelidisalsuginis]TYC08170.1 class I SAM-dependent DNA methyltransferase [Bizionia gelidisalsuginis]